eukprot:CAMPEP_0197530928 /NCGR_PEP_ID=MMETSP1318-20131121/33445_1 /TAXON_ID=552666 /ORGANISM="Partenskyella glossopodia, Strain RCC365" /LENGTH=727 /DNA_ID=CAMNT_0043086947 /DNA_START=72 /DNA_END=2255 /DNA_ORIENTATION=+
MRKTLNRGRQGRKKRGAKEPVGNPPAAELEEDVKENENMEPKTKELSPEEKAREYETTYEAKDPNVPPNLCHYHYKEKEYKTWEPKNLSSQIHMCVHFKMEGNLILKDGDEAKEQNIKDPAKPEVKLSTATQSAMDDIEAKLAAIDTNMAVAEGKITVEEAEKEIQEQEEKETAEKKDDDVYSKNQFNFSDRASQTTNFPMRSKEIATKMPPAVKFSRSVFQWTIYDRYVQEARERVAKRLASERKGSRGQKKKMKQKVLTYTGGSDEAEKNRILNLPNAELLANMLERIVVQNSKSKAFEKFKYQTENDVKDHHGDFKKTGRGSFERLFTCQYTEAEGKTVTSMCWSQKYLDMFAVGYGSYEFMPENNGGHICVFSLKNTENPEYSFRTKAGVMSLDFHPSYPNLLACGMYDGTVAAYDITSKTGEPIFIADDPKKKHWEPVWQVRWKKTLPGKPNAFTSISSDGRIVDWILAKTELVNVEVMTLKAKEVLEGEDETEDKLDSGVAGGTCFDVASNGTMYVVGTDEGAVRTYSKNYDTECLEKFAGHHHHVYATRWNKFCSRVFLTASEDWHVNLWHTGCKEPIMSFDLGKPVGDVQWAPYSSTVFACVTDDNCLRLFDLKVDKHEPIGVYNLPDEADKTKDDSKTPKKSKKKSHFTHLAFNPRDPIILVGDESGKVRVFKLSPNLRKLEQSTKLLDILILDGKVNKEFRKSSVGQKEEAGKSQEA